MLRPTGILDPFDFTTLACLAGVFAVWLFAVLGWGRLVLRLALGREGTPSGRTAGIALAAAFGSLFAALWNLAVLPLLPAPFVLASSAFLVVGCALNALRLHSRQGPRPPLSPFERLLGVFLLLYVGVRIVQSTRLARHGDPLFYHLVAPVLWVRQHGLHFDPMHPVNYAASLWEGLYLVPVRWFLRSGDVGLPQIQIFAQWTHLILGWVVIGALAYAILRCIRLPRVPALLGALAALATRSLWWTGALAKNDCGAASWTLAGVLVLLASRTPRTRAYFAAGVLFGAGFTAKYTVAFTLVPIVALSFLSSARRSKGRIPTLAGALLLGGVLGGAPIIVRNLVNLGLPFFPFGGRVRTSQLLGATTLEYIGGVNSLGLMSGWRWRVDRLGELAQEGTLAIASVLAPIVVFLLATRQRRRLRLDERWYVVVAAAIGSLVLFLLLARVGTDLRLLGPGLLLLNVTGSITILLLLRSIRAFYRDWRIPAGAVAFGAIAATSRFAPEAILDRVRELPLQRSLSTHTAGDVKVWAAGLQPRARIMTTGDQEIYYLLEHDVVVATDDPTQDALWRHAVAAGLPPAWLLREWRRSGFTYLLDTKLPREPKALCEYLRPEFERHPEWIAFRGREAVLLDLRAVRDD